MAVARNKSMSTLQMNRYAIDLIIQNKEAERVATEVTIPRKTLMTSFTRKESSASSMMKVSNIHR